MTLTSDELIAIDSSEVNVIILEDGVY